MNFNDVFNPMTEPVIWCMLCCKFICFTFYTFGPIIVTFEFLHFVFSLPCDVDICSLLKALVQPVDVSFLYVLNSCHIDNCSYICCLHGDVHIINFRLKKNCKYFLCSMSNLFFMDGLLR